MNIQPYRFTNCRCIYENYWDLLALIILIGFAMYGVLMFSYQTRQIWQKKHNLTKNSKKET